MGVHILFDHGLTLSVYPNHGLAGCRRCQSYRPPRASHCRICDYCVQQADHHCTFLNNCIGRRNYFVFLTFLFSTSVAMLSTIAISISHLILIPYTASHPAAIGNCVVISLALSLGLPVMCLLVFHLRLISRNVTTMEQVSGLVSPYPLCTCLIPSRK